MSKTFVAIGAVVLLAAAALVYHLSLNAPQASAQTAATISNITESGFTFQWSNRPGGTGTGTNRLRISEGVTRIPHSGTPCNNSDQRADGVWCVSGDHSTFYHRPGTNPITVDADTVFWRNAEKPRLQPGTPYHVGIWTFASGSWQEFSSGVVTLRGELALTDVTFSDVVDDSFTVAWGSPRFATGEQRIRLSVGSSETAIPDGATVCDAADTAQATVVSQCTTAADGTTTAAVAGLAGGQPYHVGIWQQIQGTWTKLAEGTQSTLQPPGAVDFSNTSSTGFIITWPTYTGGSGNNNIRISVGAEAAAVPEGSQACSLADLAQEAVVNCIGVGASLRSRALGNLEPDTDYHIGIWQRARYSSANPSGILTLIAQGTHRTNLPPAGTIAFSDIRHDAFTGVWPVYPNTSGDIYKRVFSGINQLGRPGSSTRPCDEADTQANALIHECGVLTTDATATSARFENADYQPNSQYNVGIWQQVGGEWTLIAEEVVRTAQTPGELTFSAVTQNTFTAAWPRTLSGMIRYRQSTGAEVGIPHGDDPCSTDDGAQSGVTCTNVAVNSTDHDASGLSVGTSYHVTVWQQVGGTWTVIAEGSQRTTAAALDFDNVTGESFDTSWTALSGGTGSQWLRVSLGGAEASFAGATPCDATDSGQDDVVQCNSVAAGTTTGAVTGLVAGTTYHVAVWQQVGGTWTPVAEGTQRTAVPPARITSITQNGFTVSWDAATGGSGNYYIRISQGGTEIPVAITPSLGALACVGNDVSQAFANDRLTCDSQSSRTRVVTGLRADTDYHVAIWQDFDPGSGFDSQRIAEATTHTLAPPPSPVVTVTDGSGCGDVTVTWQTIPGATNYTVAWTPEGGARQRETATGTSYNITDLGGGESIEVTVTVNGGDSNNRSGSGTGTAGNNNCPIDPTVTVTDGSGCGDLSVSWDVIPEATGYTVTWTPQGSTSGTQTISGGSNTSYDIMGLDGGAEVTVTVTVNGGSSDTRSGRDSGTAGDACVMNPVVAATGSGCGAITVSWGAIPGASSYTVSWTPSIGTPQTAPVTGTSYTITGLPPGESVEATVTVVGGVSAGNSDSATAAAGNSCNTYLNLAVEGTGCGDVRVRWRFDPDWFAYEYTIELTTADGTTRARTVTDEDGDGSRQSTTFSGLGEGVAVVVTVTTDEDPATTETATGTAGTECFGAVSFDTVAPTELVISWPDHSTGSGTQIVRAHPRQRVDLPSGATPCDSTDTSTNADLKCVTGIADATLTATITGLTGSTDYPVEVWQQVSGTWQLVAFGQQTTSRPPPSPVPAVTELTACGQIAVGWGAVTGAAGYTVTWSASPSGTTGSVADTSASTSRTVTGVPPGETISFTVTVNGGPSNGLSGTADGTAGSTGCPATEARTTSTDADGYTVEWDAYPGSSGTTWVRTSLGSEAAPRVGAPCSSSDEARTDVVDCTEITGSTTSATVSGLIAGMQYHIGVWRQIASTWNLIAQTAVSTSARPIPSLSGTGCGGLEVSWSAVSGGTTGYTVTWDGGGSQTISGGSTTSYTITGLTPGQSTTVTVEVVGGSEAGDRGMATGAAGDACLPGPAVTFTNPSQTGFTANWQDYAGGSGSQQVRVSPGTAALTLASGAEPCGSADTSADPTLVCATAADSATSQAVTGLAPGAQYHVGIYQQVGSAWILIAQGTTTTEAVPVGAVRFTTTAQDSFTAAWDHYAGRDSGDGYELRIFRGSTLVPLASDGVPCSGPDRAQAGLVLCDTRDQSFRFTSGLTAATQYHVSVWTRVGGAWTLIAQGTVRTNAPPSPTVSVTTGDACGEVDVSWNAITGATGYTVTWTAPGSITGTSALLDSSVTTYEIVESTLTAGQTITATVTVTGGPSETLSGMDSAAASLQGCATPRATFSQLGRTVVRVTWPGWPGATVSNQIRVRFSLGSEAAPIVGGTVCGASDENQADVADCELVTSGTTTSRYYSRSGGTNLTPGTNYHVGVWQNLSTGWTLIAEGTFGTWRTFGTSLTAVAGDACGEIVVTWNDVDSSATGFTVTYERADGTTETHSDTSTALTRTITGLNSGEEVTITVTVNGGSGGNQTVTGTANSADCLGEVTFASVTHNSFTVNWTGTSASDGGIVLRISRGTESAAVVGTEGPCSVTDSVQASIAVCQSRPAATTSRDISAGVTGSTQYHVGIWQQVSGTWTLRAEGTQTTLPTPPTVEQVGLASVTFDSFLATWSIPSGSSGGPWVRITIGATGAPLAADGVPCSTDDDAANSAVLQTCTQLQPNTMLRTNTGLTPNTEYHIGIWHTVNGTVYLIAEGTQTTDPAPAPNAATFPAANIAHDGFRVEWPDYTGASGNYWVRLSQSASAVPVPSGETPCSPADGAQALITGCVDLAANSPMRHDFASNLVASTAYHVGIWRMVGTAWVLIAEGTVTTADAPTVAVTATTGDTCGALNVSWDEASGASRYMLSWTPAGTTTGSHNINGASNTSYTIHGLTLGAEVTVTVTVTGGTLNGVDGMGTATAGSTCTPGGIIFTSNTETSFWANWTAHPGGNNNQFVRWNAGATAAPRNASHEPCGSDDMAANPGVSCVEVTPTDGDYQLLNLAPNTQYHVGIWQQVGGSYVLTAQGSTNTSAAAPPTVTVTAGPDCGSIRVTWTAITTATEYTVTTDTGFTTSSITALTFDVGGQTPGATITATVTADDGDAAGTSGMGSGPANSTCPAGNVTFTDVSHSGFTADWDYLRGTAQTTHHIRLSPGGTALSLASGAQPCGTPDQNANPTLVCDSVDGTDSMKAVSGLTGSTNYHVGIYSMMGTAWLLVAEGTQTTSAPPPPVTPTAATFASVQDNRFNVNWTAHSSGTSNTFVRVSIGGTEASIPAGEGVCSNADAGQATVHGSFCVNVTGTGALITNLTAGTAYHVGIWRQIDGRWQKFAEGTQTTTGTPPAPPAADISSTLNVAGTPMGCGAIRVTWSAVSGATYTVGVRAAGTSDAWVETAPATGVTVRDITGLAPGANYDLRVVLGGTPTGADAGDFGLSSSAVAAGNTNCAADPVVSAFTGSGCGDIDVSWTFANTDATNFTVTWDGGGTFTTTDGTARSYSITGLSGGLSVELTVTVNGGNSGTRSQTVTATAGNTGCVAVDISSTLNVSGASLGCGAIRVTWTGVAGAVGYTVGVRAAGSSDAWAEGDPVGGTVIHDVRDLTPGASYDLRVVLAGTPTTHNVGDFGLSSSAVAAGNTGCVAADISSTLNVAGTSRNCGEIRVTWTAVTNAQYRVGARPAGTSDAWVESQPLVGVNSYDVTNLTPAANYDLRVVLAGTPTGHNAGDFGLSSSAVAAGNRGCPPTVVPLVSSNRAETSFTVSWADSIPSGETGNVRVRVNAGSTSNLPSGAVPCDNTTDTIGIRVSCTDYPTSTTSANVPNLTASTQYFVAAYQTIGGVWHLIGTTMVTTLAAGAPDPIENLSVVASGSGCGEVTASWDAVDEAEGYTVEWSPVASAFDDGMHTINSGSTTSHTITGLNSLATLPGGATITVTVTAVGGDNEGATATASGASSDTNCIARPVVTSTTGVGCGGLEVTWTWPNTDADYFQIVWVPFFGTADTADGDARSYTITGLQANTELTVNVVVKGGNSHDFQATAIATTGNTGCPTPSVTATGGTGCGDLSVRWNAITGAGGYTVTWTPAGSTSGTHTINSGATTSYDITGLTRGESVMVTVTVNNGPSHGLSGSGTATAGSTRCPVPVTVTNGTGCGDLSVSWDAVEGASGYSLLWRPQGRTDNFADVSSSTTSYAITGLLGGAAMRVEIEVMGGPRAGDEGEATGTAGNNCAITAPNITLTEGCGDISASWPAVPGALSYTVEVTNPDGTRSSGIEYSPMYSRSGLDPGEQHTFTVTVRDGPSANMSSQVTFTPGAAGCHLMVNVVTGSGCGDIAVTWTPASGATSYAVDWTVGSNPAESFTVIGQAANSYTITGLAPGSSASVFVRQFGGALNGTVTAPVTVTAGDTCLLMVTATNGTSCGDATVRWAAIPGVTGYTVSWAPQSGGSDPVGMSGSREITGAAASSADLTGLTPHAQLTFTVTVVGGTLAGLSDTANARAGSTACPQGPDATISVVTASSFFIEWMAYDGTTGDTTLVRISEGSAALDVAAGDVVCGSADAAQTGVSCQTIDRESVTQAFATGLTAETDYFIQVIRSFAGELFVISTGTTRTIATPTGPAPTVTLTTGSGCGDLVVNWDRIATATGYTVTYTNAAGLREVQSISSGSTTSYTITGLTQGSSSTVSVTAVGGNSNGAFSADVVGTAGNTGCPAPEPRLTAACGSLTVRWAAVAGAQDYTVSYSDGTTSTDFGSGGALQATLSDLRPGVRYTVTVTVFFGGPSVGLSGTATATPGAANCASAGGPDDQPEGTILSLRVQSGPGCGEVGVRWDPVVEAESYTVAWTTSGTSPDATETITDGVYHLIEHDRNGIDITITVTVVGGEHVGLMDSMTTTTGYTGSCDDGLNVTASGPNCGAISIRWNATSGADSYRVRWTPQASSRQPDMAMVDETGAASYRHRVSGLGAGTLLSVEVLVMEGDYAGKTGTVQVRSGTCAPQTPIIPFTPSVPLPGAPSVDLNEPSYVRITLSDSDGVVRPGVTVTASASIVNTQGNVLSGAAPYEWSVSGALAFNDITAGSGSRFSISIPSDTPDGLYTIRATGRGVSGVASLLVDDPGEPIGGVALALGRRGDDGRCVLGDSRTPPDSSTARPGSEICLVARVLNTLGNVTNSNDVELITVRAPGGSINSGSASVFFAGASQAGFTVSSATEGTVTVSATASGVNDVEARTVSLTLTFSAEAGDHEGAGYEEEGLHCLTRLAQFSVWVCDVPILASALFEEVNLLGATAVHRWNEAEDRWQRYSAIVELPIPGSEDFVIGRGQVLFFSH